MNTINRLHKELDDYHLLTHPFYKDWSAGQLDIETLQFYAKQYYHHVDAFPRYISAAHSNCKDIKARQVLLHNLIEEEDGDANHPELWMQFCEGLDVKRGDVLSAPLLEKTKALIDGFMSLAKESYAKGLGALYAYERQVPDVAKSKIDGLETHYGIADSKTLNFFTTHIKADEWHSEECLELMNQLPDAEKKEAYNAAIKGAQLLWGFLDGIQETRQCNRDTMITCH